MSAIRFPSIIRDKPVELNIIRPVPEDKPGDDMPPPRRTGEHPAFDDGIESLMRLMIQSQTRTDERLAVAAEAQVKASTNGKTGKLPIWAPTLLTAGMLVFSGIWWTRGTERDTSADVKALKDQVQAISNEMATMRTWNERVRLNLAAEGISIDPETGKLTLGKVKGK